MARRQKDLPTEDKYSADMMLPQKIWAEEKQEPEKNAWAKTAYEMSKRGTRMQGFAAWPTQTGNPDRKQACDQSDNV